MSDRSFHVEQTVLETVDSCPLCGGKTFSPGPVPTDHLVSQENFPTHICANCGFCQTTPRPSPSQIGRFYESKDYISHANSKQDLTSKLYQLVRQRAIRGKHALVRQQSAHGQVLDIGCGTGEFLGFLSSRGYHTQGVEPSTTARAQAIENHGIEVVPSLEQVPPQEQFDVITMWHVLEHVHDVTDTAKKLYARIKPGGTLIIAVPDRESWDAAHYGADWAAYDVPRHLSHFRRRDMDRLLGSQGFTMIRTLPMWFDAPYVSMLSERHRGAGPLAALIKGVVVGGWSNLSAALSSRPTSSSLFVARKA